MGNNRFILYLFCTLVFLGSCGFGSHASRGKLSDAMEKASDDNEGDRTVETDPEEEDDFFVEETPLYYATDDSSKSAYSLQIDNSEDGTSSFFGISGGSGLISGDFRSINNVNIRFGFGQARLYGLIYGGAYWAPITAESKTGRSIESPMRMLKVGFEVHFYTTPEWTFIGNRLIGGFNIGIAQWSYSNDIRTDSDGFTESISGDMITQFELYIGTGINIAQTKYFNIGFYVLPGVLLFDDQTNEGFENDYFDPEAFLRFGINIDFKSPVKSE